MLLNSNLNLPTSHQALYNALQSAKVFVMIRAVCSGVFFKNGLVWFFDSHPHGRDDLSPHDGGSVLLSFSCLDSLVSYINSLYTVV